MSRKGGPSNTRQQVPRDRALQLLLEATRIFIAYSHRDLRGARQLHHRIVRLREDSAPETVFLDQESLLPGDRVTPKEIEDRLLNSDLLVVLCGPDTADRPHVRGEVALGLEQQRQGALQILPIISKPGVRLPEGLDFEVQGVFLTVLFPEIRWQRIVARVAGSIVVVVLVGGIARAVWATWAAPEEGWNLVRTVESGFDDALLARHQEGQEAIRTRRTFRVRGTFAEDVANTNNVFLELDFSGKVIGAFALSEDDADPSPLYDEIDRYGGVGTLSDSLAGRDWWWDGETIWSELAMTSSSCVSVGWSQNREELLDEIQSGYNERWSDDSRPGLVSKAVKAYRCGAYRVLVLIEGDYRRSAWSVRVDGLSRLQYTYAGNGAEDDEPNLRTTWKPLGAELDPAGLESLAFKPADPDRMWIVTRDTDWEDEGSVGGLFESSDGGLTWSRVEVLLEDGSFQPRLLDVSVGLGHSRRIAITYSAKAGATYGVAVSDDNGMLWRILDTGFSGDTTDPIKLVGVAGDNSVFIILPGGRLARWSGFSWLHRFLGPGETQL